MRSKFNTDADFGTLMVPTIVQGVAMAFFFIPLVTLTLSGLPPERIAAASGLSNFARITAGAMGTSLFTTLWENRAAVHHVQLSEAVNPGSVAATETYSHLSSLGMQTTQITALLNRMTDVQTFTMAADDLFRLSAWLFLALIPFVWLARPQRGGAGSDAAAGAH